MTNFIPGKIIKTLTVKEGQKAIIRYPKWEDLDKLLNYINRLSKEDTFISFSGEKITKEEETKFLASLFIDIELGNKTALFCFIKDKLIGFSNIDKNLKGRKRSRHVGSFGISIDEKFREKGIGYLLAKTTIEEAKEKIFGLKLISLDVYSKNVIGQNLYKKLGFKEYGKFPESVLFKDEYIDDIKMYLKI